MAEFLICNRETNGTKDPALNLTECWHLHDVVLVMPDGHKWGREERNPEKFRILKVPGLSVEEAREYARPPSEKNRRSAYTYDEKDQQGKELAVPQFTHKLKSQKTMPLSNLTGRSL